VGRLAGTLAALSCVLAPVACGGGTDTQAGESALPAAVASSLADKADQIASALESGDQCGAARLADELKDGVEAAVSSGQVPAALRGELERTATKLQNEVNCEEKPTKEGEDKGKKKGHDKHDDTTTLGATTTTTTTTTSTTEGD
jgi:hypothetical protein